MNIDMETYKALSYEGKISYWVGTLIVSIGTGKFRDAVALMIDLISHEAYERGVQVSKEDY